MSGGRGMIEDVIYLLKFGKKAHVEEFASGILYCSNAKTFWGIEENNKLKGQGDLLEAGARIHTQKLVMKEIGTDRIIASGHKGNVLLHIGPASEIPVFCLFAVRKDDCVIDEKGEFQISLSEKKKQIIREHFPNADTVAIIKNVNEFLYDLEQSIGYQVKHELVHYLNIDKGYGENNGQDIVNYFKYIMQDTPPIKEGGRTSFMLTEDYIYRVLFCKDVYFYDEQEYRIILPSERISNSTKYPFILRVPVEVKNIEEFFK